MILLRKTKLTITALTVLLQLSSTPVFAEDASRTTRALTDHSTRERVRVRVRVRRDMSGHRDGQGNTLGNTADRRISSTQDTASSQRREDTRDQFRENSKHNTDRDTDRGDVKDTAFNQNNDSRELAANRQEPLVMRFGNETNQKQRRVVKRLVRVYKKIPGQKMQVVDRYGNTTGVDPNILVASINTSAREENRNYLPQDDVGNQIHCRFSCNDDISRGDILQKGKPQTGIATNGSNATSNGMMKDLQDKPTGRIDRRPTKLNPDGMTGIPSQPRYKTDQDEVLAAVENGTIMPWKEALKQLSRHVSGKIIGVRMNQTAERSVYQVKVRTPDGEIKSVLVDAATGQILQTQGY